MAKRKKSKETSNLGMSAELTGLILVLIGIIGFGFGYVGTLIKEFGMFLLGSWWIVFVIYLTLIGLYMLFKRKMPPFFSKKLIGFYLVLLVVLVASHFSFLEETSNLGDILKVTFDQFMDRINTIDISNSILNSGNTTIAIGGGLIGACFITLLCFLFAKVGTIIVLVILALFGLILLFDVKLEKLFTKKEHTHREREEDNDDEDEDDTKSIVPVVSEVIEKKLLPEKNDKVIVTSLEDVKNKKNTPEVEEVDPLVIEDTVTVGSYQLPPFSILNQIKDQKKGASQQFIMSNKEILERVLKDFQIQGRVVEIHVGPAVTQFEVVVPAGTKVSRILSINKEIALALAAKDVRIEAPIPGKSTIGVEIPNEFITPVSFREVLEQNKGLRSKYDLMVTLGKDLMGKPTVTDLAKTPHLLIAGSTGSGKSVCVNSIICSLLMNYEPNYVKLVLVDPKKIELSNYNGVPHLMTPVVTNPKKASIALQKLVGEMERRYDVFADEGVKKISEYNEKIEKENKKHPEHPKNRMPYIVAIIDELADLMLVASKEVEDSIMRITQMARAAGIHLIVATQRPSTDVITGVIKANIPSRICFAVASQIDSRTALDMSGAEKLLGKGDMLFLPMGENTPTRIQGCFIADDEIERLINHCTKQVVGHSEVTIDFDSAESNTSSGVSSSSGEDDPQYEEIVKFAMETGKISASLIQRRFRFGFNRAARMIDLLEERGIIGPQNGSKPREVLVKKGESQE